MSDVFDKYALGQLSDQELKDLDKEQEQNPELLNELNLHAEAVQALRSEGRTMLKNKLNQWDEEVGTIQKEERQVPRVKPLYTWLKIAAVLLIIALPSIYFFNASTSSEALAEQHFKPLINPIPTVRAAEEAKDLHLSNAVKAYNDGNYQLAIASFNQHLSAQKETPEVSFYLYQGIAYLATDDSKKAIEYLTKADELNLRELSYLDLESLSMEQRLEIQQNAKWYLSLAYLMDNQIGNAEKLLIELSNDSSGEYSTQAKSVLKELQ